MIVPRGSGAGDFFDSDTSFGRSHNTASPPTPRNNQKPKMSTTENQTKKKPQMPPKPEFALKTPLVNAMMHLSSRRQVVVAQANEERLAFRAEEQR